MLDSLNYVLDVVICFHFIIFVLLETAICRMNNELYSCDLLSFHYLCAIRNSAIHVDMRRIAVVICFHFIIFVLLGTADLEIKARETCCDLLSFHYLCAIRNSDTRMRP